MCHDRSKSELKLLIKQWEHSFQRKHNHLPTKNDIKHDREIYKLYQEYRNYKKETVTHDTEYRKHKRESASHDTDSVKMVSEDVPRTEPSSIDVKIIESLSDAEDAEDTGTGKTSRTSTEHSGGLLRHAELGPTPQANGKVLSIFDLNLTPPESSPIKPKPKHNNQAGSMLSPLKPKQTNSFATPTRKSVKRLQFSDLTPSKRQTPDRGLSSKLQSLADEAEKTSETPKGQKYAASLPDTPLYLSKHNQKFDFGSEVASETEVPFEREVPFETEVSSETASTAIKSSPFSSDLQNHPNTPNKPTAPVNFQISPSPLKSHRFMSFGNCKKVSDLYNEYRSISIEELEEVEGGQAEINDTLDKVEDSNSADDAETLGHQARRKKPITQKRTTRRWKIKPREDGTTGNEFNTKNIHKEIKKLEAQKQRELSGYLGESISSEDEEEFDSDEELELLRKRSEASATSGRIKPISNNYQRLKINDPRKKHFKRRMQNR